MKNKNKQQQNNLSRRRFLNNSLSMSSAALIGSTGLLNLFASSQTFAASADDYKALVYVFLAGGNDANNMIVPMGDGVLRQRYEDKRGIIALSENTLNPLTLQKPAEIYGGSQSSEFGLHPSCTDMADMFNNNEMSFVCNIGNLFAPTTRQQFKEKSVTLPPQLFSHADQQKQYQSEPSNPFRYGWGGRLAELSAAHNTDSSVSPLISLSGLNSFQVSKDSVINPFVMNQNGVVKVDGFSGKRKTMMESYFDGVNDSSSLMSKKYKEVFVSGQHAQGVIESAFNYTRSNGVDYDAIFSAAGASDSGIGKQLKTVAKYIAGRASNTNNRPVFFVRMKGFDTHQNILGDHQQLMADLNNALKGFRDSLKAQNDFDKVLTFSGSEFGRTLTPNGTDASAGTDHAWGGHAILMGDMVNGGHLFGQHPDFQVGQGLDSDNKRGRWIPTTATSQVSAVISHWFGVEKSELPSLFPSLANFDDPFEASTNLQLFNAEVMV